VLPPAAQTNSGRLGTFGSSPGNNDQGTRCPVERTGYTRLSQKVPREINIHTEAATGSRSCLYHPVASLGRGPALPGESSKAGVSVKQLHTRGREGWMEGRQHDDEGSRIRQSCIKEGASAMNSHGTCYLRNVVQRNVKNRVQRQRCKLSDLTS